ncbi:hypothetical protein FPSE5266_20213 [Fusarium pseudograminearum]|nr:hypothetical protein FPSE5266_20213 [Fusarium pseudograminearum]
MKISKKQRLIFTICISFSFFTAELSVGFYTHSIALIADAFHYLSDLIGIVVALVALVIPGIESVHELHIWRLDQRKSIASAHIVVDDRTLEGFADKAKIIMECLHAVSSNVDRRQSRRTDKSATTKRRTRLPIDLWKLVRWAKVLHVYMKTP